MSSTCSSPCICGSFWHELLSLGSTRTLTIKSSVFCPRQPIHYYIEYVVLSQSPTAASTSRLLSSLPLSTFCKFSSSAASRISLSACGDPLPMANPWHITTEGVVLHIHLQPRASR